MYATTALNLDSYEEGDGIVLLEDKGMGLLTCLGQLGSAVRF